MHKNPVEANLANKPEDWPYSSYASLISNKPTQLARKELFEWFGSKADFIKHHRYLLDPKISEHYQEFG